MARRHEFERDDGDLIARLRARIAAIEDTSPNRGGPDRRGPDRGEEARTLPLGAPEVDAALPGGGLRLGALHEVVARDAAAGAGFAALILARLGAGGGTGLWCLPARAALECGALYGPGLTAFGLEPERLIVVRARSDKESLWAMEEGLRSGSLAAVLGEVASVDLTSSRRLQLAAEQGSTTAFLLRPDGAERAPSAALTRWRLGAAPSAAGAQGDGRLGGIGTPRWRAELVRCRSRRRGAWIMEWCDGTGDLTVVPELRHRPDEPAAGTRAAG